MAVSLSDGGTTAYFFEKLSSNAIDLYNQIRQQGAGVELQFHAIKIVGPNGKPYMKPLPVSTNVVIKGTATAEDLNKLRPIVETWLKAVLLSMIESKQPKLSGVGADEHGVTMGTVSGHVSFGSNFQNIPKANVKVTNEEFFLPQEKTEKSTIHFGSDGSAVGTEKVSKPPVPNAGSPEEPPKYSFDWAKATLNELKKKNPSAYQQVVSSKITEFIPAQVAVAQVPILKKGTAASPVKLSAATMLNQPVFGTSAGSTYRVIAMNDHLKVAARVLSETLSVRVEGNPTPMEKAALHGLGFTQKKDYFSTHFALDTAPAERILACIFFSSGLNWTYHIKSMNDVDLTS